MLRKAEKGKYLFSGGRPKYEILPVQNCRGLRIKLANGWLGTRGDYCHLGLLFAGVPSHRLSTFTGPAIALALF